MRYFAFGILIIALTGCAKADFNVDKEDCEKKVSNSSMAAGYGTYPPSQPNPNAMDMVDQCLSQRGWRKTTASETTEIERRQQKQQQ
jgi:hypothetical protein